MIMILITTVMIIMTMIMTMIMITVMIMIIIMLISPFEQRTMLVYDPVHMAFDIMLIGWILYYQTF